MLIPTGTYRPPPQGHKHSSGDAKCIHHSDRHDRMAPLRMRNPIRVWDHHHEALSASPRASRGLLPNDTETWAKMAKRCFSFARRCFEEVGKKKEKYDIKKKRMKDPLYFMNFWPVLDSIGPKCLRATFYLATFFRSTNHPNNFENLVKHDNIWKRLTTFC